MHSDILNVARGRAIAFGARGLLLASFAAALAGCNTTVSDPVVSNAPGSIPLAYRDRHPIALDRQVKSSRRHVDAARSYRIVVAGVARRQVSRTFENLRQ